MFNRKELRYLNKKGQIRSSGGNEDRTPRETSNQRERGQPGIFDGIPVLTFLLSLIGRFLTRIFKGGWFIFGVILTIILVVGSYNYLVASQQAAVVAEHAKTAAEERVAPYLPKAVSEIYDIMSGRFSSYAFESDIEKNKDNQNLGLKIVDLKQEGGMVYSWQPIFISGTIKAQSLDRPLTADIRCSLKDYDGNIKLSLPVSGGGNKIEVYKEIPQTYSVGCYFSDGVKVEEQSKLLLVGETKVVPRIAKEAKMIIDYNFVTKASHNTYFLNWQLKNELLAREEDPFDYYGVKDSQLKKDRTVTSVATVGPVNLGVGTYDTQPFSEDIPYYFGVSLSNNANFNGYIKKLNSLEIRLPPNMIIAGETGFEEEDLCDFYPTGTLDENGFKIYALKDEKIKEIERRCSMEDVTERKIGFEDCISLYKSSFNYFCRFMINEPIIGDSIYIDFIRAEANYEYETSRKVAVDILATPGMI